jgi:hypothetical protein
MISCVTRLLVFPAKAGIHGIPESHQTGSWFPAFAWMTVLGFKPITRYQASPTRRYARQFARR